MPSASLTLSGSVVGAQTVVVGPLTITASSAVPDMRYLDISATAVTIFGTGGQLGTNNSGFTAVLIVPPTSNTVAIQVGPSTTLASDVEVSPSNPTLISLRSAATRALYIGATSAVADVQIIAF